MPVVPISRPPPGAAPAPAPQRPPLNPVFGLMAAQQMHSEGRLVSQSGLADSGYTDMQGNTQYFPGSVSSSTHALNGASPQDFLKSHKLNPGDVMQEGNKFWMYTVPDEDGSTIMQVKPKPAAPVS